VVAAARLTRLASRDVNTLPHAAMRLMGRLDELGPTRISELAKADRCSQPTMSTLVQRQEEQAWVRREADPADSRASLISLTDAGLAELRRARQEAGAAVAARLRQLPDTDLATLEAAVAVMHRILTLEDVLEDTPR
jgi:DNA-binding MarR family transcriptional regulator